MSPISRYFKSPPGIPSVGAEDRFSALGRPGPLAEAFLLPYKASPTEIAQAIPGLQKRAKELAKHHMAPAAFALVHIFWLFSLRNQVSSGYLT